MVAQADMSALEERLNNMLRWGTVLEVDHGAEKCRAKSGQIETGWLRWFSFRAGTTGIWSPPTVGEQCMILSPCGDLASGAVFGGFTSDNHPAPEHSPNVQTARYPDGALVSYDHQAHALTATLPAGGTAEITVPGSVKVYSQHITLQAPTILLDANQTTVTGKFTVEGLFSWLAGMSGRGVGPSGKSAVVDGSIHTTEDVTAGDISLVNHRHQGVHGLTGSALP